jgi:Mce-associated membrane protein
MSDKITDDEVTGDTAPGAAPAGSDTQDAASVAAERRGTSAAQAASRARRIGGRPSPVPRESAASVPLKAAPVPSGPGRRGRPSPVPVEKAKAGSATTGSAKLDPARLETRSDVTVPEPPKLRARKTSVTPARPAGPVGATRRGGVLWWPVALVAVVAIALVGVDVWKGGANPYRWFVTPSASNAQDREQLLAQTKTKVASIIAYDYRSIDAGAAKAEAGLLDPFKSQYAKTIATVVKPQAVQVKAIVTATIENVGIVSISGNGKQAVLLVYAQQGVQNSTTGTTPRLDIATIQVTMTKVGGNWLISQVVRE